MRFVSFIPVVLAMAVGAASAQTAAPKPQETVTVLGQRPTSREMVETVIRQFVEQHAALDRKSGLIVREGRTGLCAVTMGLPDAFDSFVTARVTDAAKSVGAPVQEPGRCSANVEILFTDDPQTLVTELSDKTHGIILGFHFAHEKGSIIHVWRPIQAWYITGTRGDPHTQNSQVDPDGSTSGVHSKLRIDTAYGQSPNTGTGSHLRPANSSEIANALIVVDLSKVGGQEIGPIADYVAMLALSQPQTLDGCNAMPSILDLMSSSCAREKPKALTDSDMAYLKALYAADITTSGALGQENVANGMDRNLGTQKP
jgi:hypothetical protein